MKPLFQFRFSKVVTGVSKEEMIARFMQRLKDTYCDEFKQVDDNSIAITNDLFRIPPDLNLNLWISIRKARITIQENLPGNSITVGYWADYSRSGFLLLIYWLFLILLLGPAGAEYEDFQGLVIITLSIFGIWLLWTLISYFRHRRFFHRSLKLPLFDLGNYDWNAILRRKTQQELKLIAAGKTHLPEPIIQMAKAELLKREQSQISV